MKKVITRAEMIPPFYGVAERDYLRGQLICYPIGINLIVLLWNDFVSWLKSPVHPK